MESSVSDFGSHTYYCSIGLNRAVPMGYVYGRYPVLDAFLDYAGEFCSTGFVSGVDWVFWNNYILPEEQLVLSVYSDDSVPALTDLDPEELPLSLFDLIPDFAG